MKLKHTLTVCAMGLGLTAAVHAQDTEIKLNVPGQTPAPAAAVTPAAPAAAFTDAQLLETFGWFVGQRIGLAELEFTQTELESIIKGLSLAGGGKTSPYELEKIGPAMDQFIQKKQGVYMEKLRQKGLAESAAFLTEVKKKAGVVELPSGLVYEIIAAGAGAGPKPTDTVKVNYSGSLINGTQFDASKPGEPVEIELDQVIPGWTEGVQKIGKGGKIKLYIPPQLAYGDNGNPGIPPSSTIVFEVELVDFKATPPPAAPSAPVAPVPAK